MSKSARLGQMTDYEKLNLELWTNGAVTPQDAIGLAAKLLKDHMQIFINFEEDIGAEEVATELRDDRHTEHLNKSVEELELSVRSYQLPEERQHPDDWGLGGANRERHAEDKELRKEITARDQGHSGVDGPRVRHAPGRARAAHPSKVGSDLGLAGGALQ